MLEALHNACRVAKAGTGSAHGQEWQACSRHCQAGSHLPPSWAAIWQPCCLLAASAPAMANISKKQ